MTFAALARKRPGLSGPWPRRAEIRPRRLPALPLVAPCGTADLRSRTMVRIAITAEVFEAICATLALGSVGYEHQHSASGGFR
jgi:hypothetical protein